MKTRKLTCSALFTALTVATSLFSNPAFAGDGTNTGGGGASVVCFDSSAVMQKVHGQGGELASNDLNHIDSVETYDLYQARKGFAAQPIGVFALNAPDESADSYMKRLAARYTRTVPAVSELVLKAAETIRSAEQDESFQGVTQQRDAAQVVSWDISKCTLVTTAHQYMQGTELHVAFDMRLLDHPKNTQLSRNILVLHEGLYAIARAKGEQNSRTTRDLISSIAPAKIDLSAEKMAQKLINLGFWNDAVSNATYSGRVAYHTLISIMRKSDQFAALFDSVNERVQKEMIKEKKWYLSYLNLGGYQWKGGYSHDAIRQVREKYAYYFEDRTRDVVRNLLKVWPSMRAKLVADPGLDSTAIAVLDSWISRPESFEMGKSSVIGCRTISPSPMGTMEERIFRIPGKRGDDCGGTPEQIKAARKKEIQATAGLIWKDLGLTAANVPAALDN